MNRIFIMCIGVCFITTGFAQADTTGKKNSGQKADTIRIGGIIIIKNAGSEKKDELNIATRKKRKPSNTRTNWWVVDLGFSNINDKTDYSSAVAQQYGNSSINKSWLDQKNGKSVNVNLWFVMQQLNMIKHVVNLKYGLGLELNNLNLQRIKNVYSVENNQTVFSIQSDINETFTVSGLKKVQILLFQPITVKYLKRLMLGCTI